MTRQGGAAVHQRPYAVELSRTRRSLSAATGPVGTGSILTIACAYRQHCAGRGMPLPYNGVCGRRWCPEICSCQWRSLTAATDAIGLYVLSAAGTNRQCLPEIATAPLGPRNDTSGRRSNGNGAAHRIGGTTAASRTGLAVPAPTGPMRIERRPAYDPFFILQYSLFIISSIPLRGMANHMTKRPEIPCLSCKFPQSRRICH